ncbi:PdxA family dehydrogenase [Algoriphagus boritolerans]|uniref:PdxA family dehydrogenase n=1 Tax=Algoriphagus boritolerans TaxID=308111 RepID=UPI000AAB4EE7
MNVRKQKPIIGISIGDINGIGVEVTLKALSDNRVYQSFTPVIYGHGKVITFYRKLMSLEDFNFTQIRTLDEIQHRKVNVINVMEESPEVIPGIETIEASKMALEALKAAVADLRDGKIQALVTAPLNKSNINSEDFHFIGHTEFITESVGAKDSLMMMVDDQFRVAMVTGHLPLAKVPESITKDKIIKKNPLFFLRVWKRILG